ncbi:store-operated calcium entry-associated regulatory factor-like [Haliotis rubra]|uniref:store-operated calcium entry-associated regulatory factor-like n=1 Tax=Haliotis rubra TaxID=36100 RepID=UPI001EE605F5|nr:store-operated calcium entry-associated regulatory factor-like [Haliotis rubra]
MAGTTLSLLFSLSAVFIVATFGAQSDRVLLREISAITLRHGMQTNARRSSSVPQVKCVGGSAGCHAFVPQVVQCQNRGFDGYDVQWECKTDMDNAYRFGQVEVSCEGFDYPDDPYVLRGSCGLEYTLDLTKEGHQQKHHHSNQHNYGDDYHDRSSNYYSSHKTQHSSFGGVIGLVAAGFVIYMIYKMCLAPPTNTAGARPDQPPPYTPPRQQPGTTPRVQTYYGNAGNTGSYPNTGGYANTGTYANRGGYAGTSTNTGAGNGFGGFWTGMGAGGLLGYLFGSGNSGYGNSGYGNRGYTHRHHNTGSFWGNGAGGWGGGGGSGFSSGWSSGRSSGGSSGGSYSGGSSSGTRTASGFGGTKRR